MPEIFNIIKYHNSPHSVVLQNGKTLYRKDKLYIKAERKSVPCAPYDNHFIFETKTINYPSFQCTCGSMAVVVGPRGYLQDSSLQEDGSGGYKMFVCYSHATTGKHADGNT
jgi:hypothetical protein